VTRLLAGKLRNYGSNPSKARSFSLLQSFPDQLSDPTRLLFSGYKGLFLQAKSNHEVMLRTHVSKVLSLIIRETIHPPHTLPWHTTGQSAFELT
jgi:hypothetical protein